MSVSDAEGGSANMRDKLKKAFWFALIRSTGVFKPKLGSKLAMRFYRAMGMSFVGTPTFVASNAWFDGSRRYSLITLSEGCNISRDVRVLTHDWSPYCVLASLGRTSSTPVGRLQPVVIGPHAFVGMGAMLMPGCSVGRGAIIGAGAVVRGAVPDFALVVGNPGRIIGDAREYVKRRFPDEWSELPPG